MLTARELQPRDIPLITQYWTSADEAYLSGMGADISKLPRGDEWGAMLTAQLQQAYPDKQSYCTIWEEDGLAIGHCNVTNIAFGDHAYMHLHLWQAACRRKGMGAALVRLSLPYFFDNLQLNTLFCAPYAHNAAPNRTLERVGFRFVRQYIGVPGTISFEQEVNIWELSREAFQALEHA